MSHAKRFVGVFGFVVGGMLLIWSTGCTNSSSVRQADFARGADNHQQDHSSDHSHTDEPHAVLETIWSNPVELFVERSLAVVNKPIEFHLHLTNVETGKPISSGWVTATIVDGSQPVAQVTSREPVEPGIFSLTATVDRSGSFSATFLIESDELSPKQVALPPLPIRVWPNDREAEADWHAAHREEVDVVSFLKEQQWAADLRTTVAAYRDVAAHVTVPGRVVAPHPSEALVPPPISGRVHPPPGGSFPEAGDEVVQGQPLAAIEPTIAGAEAVQLELNRAQLRIIDAELAAKQTEIDAKIETATLDVELAQSTYVREQQLSQRGVTAAKQLLTAQNELDQAKARHAGLVQLLKTYDDSRRRLAVVSETLVVPSPQTSEPHRQPNSAEKTNLLLLTSPINGTVVEADATAGEYVAREHSIFRIVNLDRLFIEADVSEYDLSRVESSLGARYRLSAYPNHIVPIFPDGGGRLVFIGSVVDPETRTVSVRYEVPNRDRRLRLGMFAEVLIETDRVPNALVVPKTAIVDEGGQPAVYVQTGGESFQQRAVQLGLSDGEMIEILSGIKAPERIVSHGGYLIRLSTLSGGVPEHHHH